MIWLENGEQVELEELLSKGPMLLLVYLFDWSPT